jgi:4'-phosphopantetheinyl transferase
MALHAPAGAQVTATAAVHVWICSISAMRAQRAAMLEAITEAERARMSKFYREADQLRFLIGRCTLRREVGAWRGLAPLEVPLTFGPQGKPMITGGPHVNVTHSGDLVGIAICDAAPVGIDIEKAEQRHAEREGLDTFFSPAEIRAHVALPDDVRETSFFHIWTSKEALLKVAATGLSLSLQSFDVAVDPSQAPALIATRCQELAGDVCLVRVDVPIGYAAALAVFAPTCELIYRSRV